MAKLIKLYDGTENELIQKVPVEAVDGLGIELDTINGNFQDVANEISTLEASSHKHANPDALAEVTLDLIASWKSAATNSHTHGNKTVIDSLTQTEVERLKYLGDDLQEITDRFNQITMDYFEMSQRIQEIGMELGAISGGASTTTEVSVTDVNNIGAINLSQLLNQMLEDIEDLKKNTFMSSAKGLG